MTHANDQVGPGADLHITGMIWARPTSDLEAPSSRALQPEFIEAITRAHGDAGCWTNAADGFLVLAHGASVAKRIHFLLAHRPGFVPATAAARKLATSEDLTGGRLALHVISGCDDADRRKDGDYADHDARYRLSIGIEHIEDILTNLERKLAAAGVATPAKILEHVA